MTAPSCLRCGQPLPEGDPHRGFCTSRHKAESQQQLKAFRLAGPGCTLCYRGGVFFRWRVEGGRERVAPRVLEQQHVAPCHCAAGQKIRLEGGYKTWGYMRDFGPEGAEERAPERSVMARTG